MEAKLSFSKIFACIGIILFLLTHAIYWRLLLFKIDTYGFFNGLQRAQFVWYALALSVVLLLANLFLSKEYRGIEKSKKIALIKIPLALHVGSQVVMLAGLLYMYRQCNAPGLNGYVSRCKDDGLELIFFVIYYVIPSIIIYLLGTALLVSKVRKLGI